MDNKPQPVALKLAEMLPANESLGHETLVSYARECVAELLTQHARITELESQLAQRFDAADMATAAAQGFRDGVASLSANAGEPRNAIDRDALIDAIAQGLHGTWHCTRVWEAWHVGTMSQDDFEPVDESETPTEIADAVLALLAAQPAAQQGVAYAALPTSSHAGRVYEEGFLIGTCPLYTADQLHAFADATQTLRASNGQAPAGAAQAADSVQEDAARYRWLREGNEAKHDAAWHVAVNLYGCEWDAAIDAALAAQGGE